MILILGKGDFAKSLLGSEDENLPKNGMKEISNIRQASAAQAENKGLYYYEN